MRECNCEKQVATVKCNCPSDTISVSRECGEEAFGTMNIDRSKDTRRWRKSRGELKLALEASHE